jgi:hypothetical protein
MKVTSEILNSYPMTHNKIQIIIHNTITSKRFKTIKNRADNIIEIINKKKKRKILICKTLKNKTTRIFNKTSMMMRTLKKKVHRMKRKT